MLIWWLDAQTKKNVKTGTYEHGYHFKGISIKDSWVQPKIEFMSMSYTPKDFVSFDTNTAFLVSQRVANFLKENFSTSVELIEFPNIKDKQYYLVNVIKLIGNCINLNMSGVTLNNEGAIQNIDGYVFKENCIIGPEIFKVKEFPRKVFITDEFKRLLETNKFTGMEFIRPEVTLRDLFYGTY
jgi:hypothetical protein